MQALLKLGAAHFRWPVDESIAPTVNWPDAVQQYQASVAQTLAQIETKVRMLHPDWTDDQVGAEVQRIRDEQGVTTADPLQFASHLAATGQLTPPGQADDAPPAQDW